MTDKTLRIALTGATGLVGGAILKVLLEAGHSVLVLVRDTNDARLPNHKNLQRTSCDLHAVDATLSKPLQSFLPEVMIHAGWIGSDSANRNQSELLLANIHASLTLQRMMHEAGCKRWIGFGSQAEYEPNITGTIREDASTKTTHSYGMAKRELYLKQQSLSDSLGMRLVWLRLFTCYGKTMHPNYVIPSFIREFKRGVIPDIKTPHALHDFLHADDVGAAISKVLKNSDARGVYNLASGVPISIGDVALILAALFPNIDIRTLQTKYAPVNDPITSRIAEITAFTRDFSWQPSISIAEGLRRCL